MFELNNTSEIVIRLPKNLLSELDSVMTQENVDRSEFIHQATKMYLEERKKRYVLAGMENGYAEMAKLNLSLASEAFAAESEAEHTVRRIVSGG